MNFKGWFLLQEDDRWPDIFQRFVQWYSANRRNWQEVEAAAHKDPIVFAKVNYIKRQMEKGMLSKKGSYQMPFLFSKYARELEAVVQGNYGHNQNDPMAFQLSPTTSMQSPIHSGNLTQSVKKLPQNTQQPVASASNFTQVVWQKMADIENRLQQIEKFTQNSSKLATL